MKIMINYQILHQSTKGFDHANLVNSFRGSKYLPKLDSVTCIFSNMSTKDVLFEKMMIF